MSPYDELAQELKCPIDWDELPTGPELTFWLDYLWYARCHFQQVDKEVSHSFSSLDWRISKEELSEWEVCEIRAWLHNVRTWIKRVRKPYLQIVKRFSELRAASRDIYAKHYSPPDSSFKDISELSLKRSASILVPSATPELQESMVWAVLDELVSTQMFDYYDCEAYFDPQPTSAHFVDLFDVPSMLVGVSFKGKRIGASAGESTTYGMIDIDFSTPQFHMYPVSCPEFQAASIQAEVDGEGYGLT